MNHTTGHRTARKYPVALTDEDRNRIKKAVKAKEQSMTIRKRGQILLRCDLNSGNTLSQKEIAAKVGVHLSTVTRTVKQYTEEGLESVLKFKHNPASEDGKRKVDGKVEGTVVSLACSKAPAGRARWTNVLLSIRASQELGMKITPEMVRRILKKNKLRPHKNRYWCVLPSDPEKRKAFVTAMEDILGVYACPYNEDYPVVCMDEKPCVLHEDVHETMEAIPGIDRRQDHEYRRRGTCSVFLFLEPLTGEKYVSVRKHRTSWDFAYELLALSARYPNAKKIVLVLDNLNTHTLGSLYKAFPQDKADAYAERFELHYTPVHASWLNIAEIGLSVLSREAMGHLRFQTIEKLRKQLKTWMKTRGPVKVNWQFTVKDAQTKLRSLYPTEENA